MSDVRLQFVVGKGGVGKSTITAALALASARRGFRTLVVEIGAPGGLARLFGVAGQCAAEPLPMRPGLSLLCIQGDEALAEYLTLALPIKRLVRTVLTNRFYRVFVAAAPGLKELMTIGKIWFELHKTGADGQPLWDRIIVDAGASGHSLQYLQMPAAAAQTFGSGLVHREATRVLASLRDGSTTCVHVVAIPEEMPITEAVGIVERLRAPLQLPMGTLFVNRCRPSSPEGVEEAVAALENVMLPPADEEARCVVLQAAQMALGWERIQEAGIARLASETGLVPVRVPLLVREEFGLNEVDQIANQLAREASS
jgi:anion-transporting  ArsA/GET3 family ATPase